MTVFYAEVSIFISRMSKLQSCIFSSCRENKKNVKQEQNFQCVSSKILGTLKKTYQNLEVDLETIL